LAAVQIDLATALEQLFTNAVQETNSEQQ
jgi:hypothetical protein